MDAAYSNRAKVVLSICIGLAFTLVLVACATPGSSVAPADIASPSTTSTIPPITTTLRTEVRTGTFTMSQVIADDGGDPATVDLIYADSNQCSTLFDLDEAKIQEAVPYDLFWTWNLNFNLQPVSMTTDIDFYGCLHFFWRDSPGAPFYPATEYILTPCWIDDNSSGGITYSPHGAMESSVDGNTVQVTRVYFPGSGHIWCDLNLGVLGAFFAATDQLSDNVNTYWSGLGSPGAVESLLTHVQEELLNLRDHSPAYYPAFSLGGVAGELVAHSNPAPQPLIFYRPNTCTAGSECVNFWLSPQFIDFPHLNVAGGVAAQPYTVPIDQECAMNPSALCLFVQRQSPWLHIMEYGQATITNHSASGCNEPIASGHDAFLVFHAKEMGGASGEWWQWCPENIEPDIYSTPAPDGLEVVPPFWTGSTTIYVGRDPVNNIDLEGYLYEVWIDPDGMGTGE